MFCRKKYPVIFSLLFTAWLGLVAAVAIIFYWQIFMIEQKLYLSRSGFVVDNLQISLRRMIADKRPARVSTPAEVKGIYLTARTAASPKRMDYFIDLIDRTELNSIVIDVKTDYGWVAYDTDSELINKLATEKVIIKDLSGLLKRLHEHNIYAIARLAVFQDSALADTRPDWTIGDSVTGGTWADWKGVKWLDPHKRDVWEYGLALAKDAAQKGFDEINFDYVRFPSDGPMSRVVYAQSTDKTKAAVLNDYFAYLRQGFADVEVKLSVDLFGMTLWNDFDFNIGQTIAGAAPWFDYISPMIYPSHYPNGFQGFANPAAYPYEMTQANLEAGRPRFTGGRATLRPWLQDFSLGAVYTPAMVRAEIDAVEANASTTGWLLWNASNHYTEAALLPAK